MFNMYQFTTSNTDTSADEIREKLEDAKDWLKEKFYCAVDFAISNPDKAAAIAWFAYSVLRKADKYVDIYRENKLRNSMIYDRSLGMYWKTKRPLTTNQRLIIESRHKAGEPYGAILNSMKLLKR